MLLNIRGTNGSGKTTLAKSFFTDPASKPVLMVQQTVAAPTKRDPNRTRVREIHGTPGKYDSIILGSYLKSCGGCDEFSWKGSHDGMVEAIRWGAKHYSHVIFEGLTVTSSYGRYVALADEIQKTYGPKMKSHWIMLNIGVDECIRRVAARNGKPTTERVIHNVTKKNETVVRTIEKLSADFPARHQDPTLGWSSHATTEDAVKYAHELVQYFS